MRQHPNRKFVENWSPNYKFLIMDGFDDCIVGIVTRSDLEPFVVYDRDKVIKKLMQDGMSYEDAVEYHQFNQFDGCAGDNACGFIETPLKGASHG